MSDPTWSFDPAHSGIHFTVRHMVFAKVRGRFASWRGRLDFEPSDLASASVEAEIDAASIDTGVADRDAHLRSADFFDAESFPVLRFRSTAIEPAGGDRYRIRGDLTIRDVTREVVLDVEHGGVATDPWGRTRAGFSATASIDRKDFGLTWNQALEAGGVLVGDRVEIAIDVEALRSAAAA